jgi:L-fuconolactonase
MKSSPAIVDSHVHLWDPKLLRYTWLDGLPELNRSFLPAEFCAASSGVNVTKMVFVEGGREPSQSLAEVDWVIGLATAEPRICGIIAHVPLEDRAASLALIAQLWRRPLVKGVRRLLQGEGDPEFCLRPDFIASVKLLKDFRLTLDLCIRHEQLSAVTKLVQLVPEVQFVLDHFGKPPVRDQKIEPWATQLKALAKLPNVSCKISGLATEADWQNWTIGELRPYFEIAFEAFGFDRVLFGGDWPVCTLAVDYPRWVDTVVQLAASANDSDRRKLFRENAERIYHV